MITEAARTVVVMLGDSEWSLRLLCFTGSSSFVIRPYKYTHLSGIIEDIEDCFLCLSFFV